MKLKDFPHVLSAFTLIQHDQYLDGMMINKHVDVHTWTEALAFTEAVFVRLHGKVIGKFMPELPKMQGYEGCELEKASVFEGIVMSINDSTELLLQKAGLKPLEVWVVSHVLESFFEGELRNTFEVYKKGSRAARLIGKTFPQRVVDYDVLQMRPRLESRS